jgi:DNA-binding MarR family transcriptional regulator
VTIDTPLLRAAFDDLIRVETVIWDEIDSRMRAECNTPLSRFEPMAVIASSEQCRVSDVADQLSITMGGASKLVERIRADGLCERRPNPSDRRSWFFRLTSRGTEVLAEAQRVFDLAVHDVLGTRIDERRLRELAGLLNDLRHASTNDRKGHAA